MGEIYHSVGFVSIRMSVTLEELVKRVFSRKDAKNAKKKSLDINQMALRPLRLGVTF
jgi:hypothetical protein